MIKEIDLDSVYENNPICDLGEKLAKAIFDTCLNIGGTEKQFRENCEQYSKMVQQFIMGQIECGIDEYSTK